MTLEVAWTSKTVPGTDVSVTLPDGRAFALGSPAVISDLTVPANGSLPLPLNLLVRDSKLASSGTGVLTVSLRLQDLANSSQDVVQSLDTSVAVNLDLKSIAWTQTISLAGEKVQCLFPKLTVPAQEIASFQITKAKGSDQVHVLVAVPGSASSSVSPVITASDSHVLPYYEEFSGKWTVQNVLDFLNKMAGPNSPSGVWAFKSCSVAP